MKRKLRKILIIILAAALLLSLVMLALQYAEHLRGRRSHEQALSLVALPEPEAVQPMQPEQSAGEEDLPQSGEKNSFALSLANMDLSPLQQTNSQVIGWIVIPDTVVSYPLVQAQDNSFYLSHNWEKQKNVVGAVFLEQSNSPDMSDKNTIIYAHRLNNGEMFGSMWMYEDAGYMVSHPLVYVVTEDGCRVYRIFAAYHAHVKSWTYALDLSGEGHMAEFLAHCMESSVVDSGVEVGEDDSILTLSTCTLIGGYSKRWVVQAVLEDFVPADVEYEGTAIE